MPELKASSVQYKFSTAEIKKMLAKELDVPETAIIVTYDKTDVSNDRFDRYPMYEITSVTVTVDNTMLECNKRKH